MSVARDLIYFSPFYLRHSLFALDEVGIDISNHVGAFMSKADLGVRMQGEPRISLSNKNNTSKMPLIDTIVHFPLI